MGRQRPKALRSRGGRTRSGGLRQGERNLLEGPGRSTYEEDLLGLGQRQFIPTSDGYYNPGQAGQPTHQQNSTSSRERKAKRQAKLAAERKNGKNGKKGKK